MSNFRLMLLSTAAAGLVAAAVSPASAGEVEKSVAISGHVNRAIVISDDGLGTTVGQIDATYVSGSRARIDAKAKSESMTVRAYTELGIQANPSSDSQSDATSRSINLRHSYISVGSDMGTLTVGHTSYAGAFYGSNSLASTGNGGNYDGPILGGQVMRPKTGAASTAGGTSGITVGAVTSNFQGGGGRKSNIKYDSPNFSGFSFAVGHADNDHGSAGLGYSGDFDGTKVIANVGVRSVGGTSATDKEFGGSMAIALAGGLNAAVAYTQRDLTNGTSVAANTGLKDPDHWGAAIGYTMGANGINLQYGVTNDLGANGNEATRIALIVNHNLSEYGASIYGGISNIDYDTPATATQYDDLTGGWVGIRVNF